MTRIRALVVAALLTLAFAATATPPRARAVAIEFTETAAAPCAAGKVCLYAHTDHTLHLQTASADSSGFAHAAAQVALATSGAVTIDPTAGETFRLAATANVTGITFLYTTAAPGQLVTLILKQNAGGTATWPTVFSNARLAGGTFTKTATANSVDVITFRFDAVDTQWREVSRSLNQT